MSRRHHAHADERPQRRRSVEEQLEGLALWQQPLAVTLPAEPRRGSLPPSEPHAPRVEASEDAADRLSRTGRAERLRQRTLLAYARVYPQSMTADECADRIGEHPFSIRPRCTQLQNKELLARTNEKRPSSMGNPQHALVITEDGLKEARKLATRRHRGALV